jgi:Kef-type K+ transport system membrane component KefB
VAAKQRWNVWVVYALAVCLCVGLTYWITGLGIRLERLKEVEFVPQLQASTWHQFQRTLEHNVTHPLSILLLQISTIMVAAHVLGYLCRKVGLPSVIGEVAAGITLGPSLVGRVAPQFSAFLFPPDSLSELAFLSQVGLILFMFVVGMELDINVIRKSARDAVLISHGSIVLAFLCGVSLAYYLYGGPYAPDHVRFLPFALFMGSAMSIAAFPVLARIVQERQLSRTPLGGLTITTAAIDDLTAWCLLAMVIAVVKAGSVLSALITMCMAAGYVVFMITVIRPFLKRLGDIYGNHAQIGKSVVAIFFSVLILSSYATEVIGIHALFGAFMAGTVMPSNPRFRSFFIERVEDVAMVLLMPLFFVYTGLRTQIGLLTDPGHWRLCAIVLLVAVGGKALGTLFSARLVGQGWKNSAMLGVLMNTRGLVELVVLNIGYDLGVISPVIFTAMVIMALVTTLMTGPLLSLIERVAAARKRPLVELGVAEPERYHVLIAYGDPARGVALLRLANQMVQHTRENTLVTALHLAPSAELHQHNAAAYERTFAKPLKEEARVLGLPVATLVIPAQDLYRGLLEQANSGGYDLMLAGVGRSVFEGSFLGRLLGFTTRVVRPQRLIGALTGRENLFHNEALDERSRLLLKSTRLPLGLVIDKGLGQVRSVVVPFRSISDSFLLVYAGKLLHHGQATLRFFDMAGAIAKDPELRAGIAALAQGSPNRVHVESATLAATSLAGQDLVLTSLESWEAFVSERAAWLASSPSALILRP